MEKVVKDLRERLDRLSADQRLMLRRRIVAETHTEDGSPQDGSRRLVVR